MTDERGASGMASWYALRVRTRSERTTAAGLSRIGCETYLAEFSTADGRLRPAFPGYVFARFEGREKTRVLAVRGVHKVLSVHGVPSVVSAAEIDSLRAALAHGATPAPLAIGQRVRVMRGPLKDLEGELVSFGKPGVLQVGITILNRAVRVSIDVKDVKPL
jgi:transcription termination/antitermination protein NusG